MSGFFSLAGATEIGKVQDQDQHQQQENDIISPYSLYLFKNDEIYSKRFELWQQYYQLHQHQYDHHKRSSDHNSKDMRQGEYGVAGGSGSGGGSGGGGINCQDCGNQAKKDCQHMRCRTCCKARGFHCQTHVKSTWVPAAKRREHQQQLMSLTTQQQQQHNSSGNQQLSLMMRATTTTSGDDHQQPKRLREDHHHHESQPRISGAGAGSGVMLSTTQHHTTSSGLQVGHFPAEVSSPAVFRCVRVSAMNESEEEQLAYQTSLNVGGHVFKGILYDHGPDEGSSSSRGGGQQLNLITHSGGTTAASTSMNPGVSFVDHSSSAYPTPFSAFMAGTQFFPPPRS